MREVYSRLYVGDDSDYEKVKDKSDWRILRCAKEGPGGHRDVLKYKSLGAPKDDPNYLFVERPRKLITNLVDSDRADFIPTPLVDKALSYISDSLRVGKLLIACNQGESRAPSLAFLWLYLEGKLPADYHRAVRTFRTLYPAYSPANGIRQYVKDRISAAKHRR